MGKNKGLKDLELLGELDGGSVPDDNSSDTGFTTPVSREPVSDPTLKIKYVCIDRGTNTAPPLQRVGGGFLLYNTKFTKLKAGSTAVIHTGIQMQIPKGYQGRVTVLNRIARSHVVTVGGGIVDANNVNEIQLVLINHGSDDRVVNEGNAIGILNIEKVPEVDLVQVPSLKATLTHPKNVHFTADLDNSINNIIKSGPALLGGFVSKRHG